MPAWTYINPDARVLQTAAIQIINAAPTWQKVYAVVFVFVPRLMAIVTGFRTGPGHEAEELHDRGPHQLGDRLPMAGEREAGGLPVPADDVPALRPDEGVAVEDVARLRAHRVIEMQHAVDGQHHVRGNAGGAEEQLGFDVAGLGCHDLPGVQLLQEREVQVVVAELVVEVSQPERAGVLDGEGDAACPLIIGGVAG